jgi:hypothetical protein
LLFAATKVFKISVLIAWQNLSQFEDKLDGREECRILERKKNTEKKEREKYNQRRVCQ